MGSKVVKIKRHKKIYYENVKRKRLGFLATGMAVVGLFCAGFFLAPPLMNYISGVEMQENDPDSVSANNEADPPAEDPTQMVTPPVQEDPLKRVEFKGLKALYIPIDKLNNEADLESTLSMLEALGMNAVVTDLKDSNGYINYNSGLESVKKSGAQNQAGCDLSQLTAQLSSRGITLIGRVFAFEDNVFGKYVQESRVMYSEDHNIPWIDEGRKQWLNPNSSAAQGYISDVVSEIVSLGVNHVLLDSLRFPSDYMTYYGEFDSKSAVLNRFVSDLEQKLSKTRGQISVMGAVQYFFGSNAVFYGGSLLDYSLSVQSPLIFPESMPDELEANGVKIENPAANAKESTQSIVLQMQLKNGNRASIFPFLSNVSQNTSNVKNQIEALEQTGLDCYVIYNAEGKYENLYG